jgi:peptidoglycan hydrolase-like protein with peptidoglycan-binding domain
MQIANTNTIAKVAAVVAGLGLVAMTFVAAAPAKAADSMMFNTNLTVGSRGADVTALQNWLIGKGFSIAAGATGYFGGQTKAAVAAYQKANGISPAVGYFGPLTRASVNAGGGSTGSTGGSTTGISGTNEGSINIEKESSGLVSTLYEGDSKAKVLGVRIEAKDSDVNFSRIRVSLGNTTDTYNKQVSRVYLIDDSGNVLASKDLNTANVTRVSGTPVAYYVTLTGFSSIIKKDQKRSYYVAFDAYPSISSTYQGSKTLALYGADAIRVTDGAGLDQYSSGADTTVTQTFTISSNLSDSARLTPSTDPAVRKATTIVADQGANNNEKDKEEVGSFRLLAEKDDVLLRDIDIAASTTGSGAATLQTLYMYDGSTSVGTASGVAGTGADTGRTVFHFTSINQSLTKDAYKTYTLKADFRSANTTTKQFQIASTSIVSAESKGTGKSLTNVTLAAGVGETMTVVSSGATVTLATPTISIVTSKNTSGTTTEGHLTSVFSLSFTAIGADAVFGSPASAFSFVLLKNGVATTSTIATRTVFYPGTQPTGTTNYSASGFTIPRNSTVTIPVTFKVDANTSGAVDSDLTAGTYSVRLNTVTYTSNSATVANDYSSNVNYVTAGYDRP